MEDNVAIDGSVDESVDDGAGAFFSPEGLSDCVNRMIANLLLQDMSKLDVKLKTKDVELLRLGQELAAAREKIRQLKGKGDKTSSVAHQQQPTAKGRPKTKKQLRTAAVKRLRAENKLLAKMLATKNAEIERLHCEERVEQSLFELGVKVVRTSICNLQLEAVNAKLELLKGKEAEIVRQSLDLTAAYSGMPRREQKRAEAALQRNLAQIEEIGRSKRRFDEILVVDYDRMQVVVKNLFVSILEETNRFMEARA